MEVEQGLCGIPIGLSLKNNKMATWKERRETGKERQVENGKPVLCNSIGKGGTSGLRKIMRNSTSGKHCHDEFHEKVLSYYLNTGLHLVE